MPRALQIFQNETIDLLLTDIQMGGINGVELAERIMEEQL